MELAGLPQRQRAPMERGGAVFDNGRQAFGCDGAEELGIGGLVGRKRIIPDDWCVLGVDDIERPGGVPSRR